MSMQVMRASDRERDRIVEILKEQTVQGRLSLEEFEQRTGAAYAARTRLQLQQLTEDLPETIRFGRGGPESEAADRHLPGRMPRCLAMLICCCGGPPRRRRF
jgi:hypothetical protein